ncbi:hypothetical protein OFL77_27290, partial [Escherichia coli]|uniref:hypothetical protein n=1 Tax=Escherichia coli TaxID=562 RepID=UPI0021E0A130
VMLGVRPGVIASDTYLVKIGAARGFSSVVNLGVASDNMQQMFDRRQSVLNEIAGHNAHVLISEHINSQADGLPVVTYRDRLASIVG